MRFCSLAREGSIEGEKLGLKQMIDQEGVQTLQAYSEEIDRLGAANHDSWRIVY
jgi:microcompartment protein CcmK/EutM